jgi:TonB family protein
MIIHSSIFRLVFFSAIICLQTSVVAHAQDHEYYFESWLISATDFSSVEKLEVPVDDCDLSKKLDCATSGKHKPPTTYETGGAYISHNGDRAKVLAAVQPCYPKIAKAAKASGAVDVLVVVDEKGHVIWARAVNGHPLLQFAAVRAACKWRFEKALFGSVNRMIRFSFQLE